MNFVNIREITKQNNADKTKYKSITSPFILLKHNSINKLFIYTLSIIFDKNFGGGLWVNF
ncbi:hypothetical protein MMMIC1C10_03020 [Methanococcus maripaludis]